LTVSVVVFVVDVFHLLAGSVPLLFNVGRFSDDHAGISVFIGFNIRSVVDSTPSGSLRRPLELPKDDLVEVKVRDSEVLCGC
jgi:hypothetical protein